MTKKTWNMSYSPVHIPSNVEGSQAPQNKEVPAIPYSLKDALKLDTQDAKPVADKGVKNDAGKTQWHYLPIEPIKKVLEVLAYGDKKYPSPDGANWKRVEDAKKRYYDALLRHVTEWYNGETHDKESGLHHLAHACSNCLFLLWFALQEEKNV